MLRVLCSTEREEDWGCKKNDCCGCRDEYGKLVSVEERLEIDKVFALNWRIVLLLHFWKLQEVELLKLFR